MGGERDPSPVPTVVRNRSSNSIPGASSTSSLTADRGPDAPLALLDSPFMHVSQDADDQDPQTESDQGFDWEAEAQGLLPNSRPTKQAEEPPQLTVRALAAGLLIGSLLCFSNMYFGLQTGWVTMGSLQSAILGFGVFKAAQRCGLLSDFSAAEIVIVQTTSVATATMPLAAGLVGVIPAIGMLTPGENPPQGPIVLSTGQLLLWSLALAFFGVFFAVPLRTQTILKEKLRFPSGTATANVIRTLFGLSPLDTDEDPPLPSAAAPTMIAHQPHPAANSPPAVHPQPHCHSVDGGNRDIEAASPHTPRVQCVMNRGLVVVEEGAVTGPALRLVSGALSEAGLAHCTAQRECYLHCSSALAMGRADTSLTLPALPHTGSQAELREEGGTVEWSAPWHALLASFAVSGIYSLIAGQVEGVRSFPIFTWIGLDVATRWGWDLTPSMGYIGQGMIMGPRTAYSMLAGAVAGYGILGPIARAKGWAPGPITDWETGASGWVLWVSLAIMLGDSLTSLSLLSVTALKKKLHHNRQYRQLGGGEEGEAEVDPYPPEHRIPTSWWVTGLLASTAFCSAVLAPMFDLPLYEPLVAVCLALLVAVLAVRALGETDLNPVSGVGKLSQAVFALIAPGRVVPNLVAGAIAEAGAQQAGDMMQDFKTAHLLGVCPRAQFFAMLLGSGASVAVSVAAFKLYTSAWEVPGPRFPVPTAAIWLDMARLVNGGKLPPHVLPFCGVAALVAALMPAVVHALQLAQRQQQRQSPSPLKNCLVDRLERYLPSGIGFGVGLYIAPRWTLPRVIGAMAEQAWKRYSYRSHKTLMIVVASGLVLGEGTASIITALLQSLFFRR